MPNFDERNFVLWTTALSSRALRHALLAVLLAAERPLTVGELVERLEQRGYSVAGAYPAKTVSDAMGHECARGRAKRVRRGTYAVGRIADTTRRRILARYGRGAVRSV